VLINDAMRAALLRHTDLASVSRDEVPSQFRMVAVEGWTQDADGALLLGALRRSYVSIHGSG
jgi:hypothetical protein